MGPRVGMDKCGKSRPPPGFDPRTLQPVASRYTCYATLALAFLSDCSKLFSENYILFGMLIELCHMTAVQSLHHTYLHSIYIYLSQRDQRNRRNF